MIKRIATALTAAALTLACATSPMTSSSQTSGSAAGVTVANVKDAADYILLSSPDEVRSWDYSSNYVRAFHIRGTMTNRGFVPVGEVRGNGKLCSGQDWLSLSDIKVYKAGEGKTPVAPYVLGCATSAGFQPASQAIVQ